MARVVEIARVDTVYEGHRLVSLLGEIGIEAEVDGANTGTLFSAPAAFAIRVLVAEADRERAATLLAELAPPSSDDDDDIGTDDPDDPDDADDSEDPGDPREPGDPDDLDAAGADGPDGRREPGANGRRDPADRVAAGSVAADRVAADSVAADRVAADRVAADSVAADSVAADSVAEDGGTAAGAGADDPAPTSRASSAGEGSHGVLRAEAAERWARQLFNMAVGAVLLLGLYAPVGLAMLVYVGVKCVDPPPGVLDAPRARRRLRWARVVALLAAAGILALVLVFRSAEPWSWW